VRRSVVVGTLALFLLMALLVFSGWRVLDSQPVLQITADSTQTNEFRSLFWNERALDIGVHVALLFASALGVAALLPSRSEEQEVD